MPPITESTVKKFWAVSVIVAGLVFGGAVWATKVSGDIESLKASAVKQEEEMKGVAGEIRRLRESMIRAGTAIDEAGR